MGTTSRPETGKIYQFPRRSRTGEASRRDAGRRGAPAGSQGVAPVEFGAGWYHEAAIQDARRPVKP